MLLTKRSINLMILAFAQQLYLHFEEDDLAVMAKEASEKSVGAVNYGTKAECDLILSSESNNAGIQWPSVAELCRGAAKTREVYCRQRDLSRRGRGGAESPVLLRRFLQIDANGVVKKRGCQSSGR